MLREGDRMARAATLDLVTVVFRREVPLLNLQARSIARFFDPRAINGILVVVNDVHENDCVAQVEEIRASYGHLADKVRIVRPEALLSDLRLGPLGRAERRYVHGVRGAIRRLLPRRERLANGWRGNSGWSMQQAQKLLAANVAEGSHVLILDAKNFFGAPVGVHTFVSRDGRARSRRVQASDLQRKWLRASYRALGIAGLQDATEVPPSATPFVVERKLMQEALAFLEARLGPMEVFFARRKGRATEFTLLFAAIDRGTGEWWKRFAEGLPATVTAFAKRSDADVQNLLKKAREDDSRILGIHRRVMARIRQDTSADLIAFLIEIGLFASAADARAVFSETEALGTWTNPAQARAAG